MNGTPVFEVLLIGATPDQTDVYKILTSESGVKVSGWSQWSSFPSTAGIDTVFYEVDSFNLDSYLQLKSALGHFKGVPFVLLFKTDDKQFINLAVDLKVKHYIYEADINRGAVVDLLAEITMAKQDFTPFDAESHSIWLLEHISDAFMAADRNWKITYVNKVAEQQYKIRRGEVVGRSVWEVFPKTAASHFYDAYMRCMNDQEVVFVHGLSPTSGKWIETTAYPTKDGIAVYFKDCSEQVLLQNEIGRQKINLQKLIDNVNDLVWSVDRDMKIIICNKVYSSFVYDMTGEVPAEGTLVLWKTFDDAFYQRRKSQYERGLKGEGFVTVDRMELNGKFIYFDTSFAPIIDEDGIVTGVCCHSRDVTVQLLHLEKIERQNVLLQEIAFIQSHHVRAPLTKIMALTGLFKDDEAADEEQAQIIEYLKISALELDQIIREIVSKTAVVNHIIE